jgi:hypothetical protein
MRDVRDASKDRQARAGRHCVMLTAVPDLSMLSVK